MPVGRTGPVLGKRREKVLEVAKPVSTETRPKILKIVIP